MTIDLMFSIAILALILGCTLMLLRASPLPKPFCLFIQAALIVIFTVTVIGWFTGHVPPFAAGRKP